MQFCSISTNEAQVRCVHARIETELTEDLFTIDYFGGWADATPDFFSDEGIFSKVLVNVQGSDD